MPARPARFYRPELDAVRFVLFAMVFFGHYKEYVPISTVAHPYLFEAQVSIGWVLPVFFLLSAFLIVELLMREREKTGTVAIKMFYVRRVLRIWPLYFGVFYGLALLAHWVPKVGPPNHLSWLAFTLFAGNLYILKYGWVTYTIAPLWSISVEEQFYIAVPWVAKWWGGKAIAWTSVLFIVGSYLTIWWNYRHLTAADDMIWVNSLVQFQFFAAGALLALALRKTTLKMGIPARVGCYLATAACWWTAEHYLHWTVSFWHPLSLTKALAGWALGLTGAVLLFLGTLGLEERYVPKWLVKMGNMSFGLYLFHSMALYFCFFTLGKTAHRHLGAAATPLLTVLACGIVWAMAAASYRWIEMPFLNLKKHFTVVESKPTGAVAKAEGESPAPREVVSVEQQVSGEANAVA